MKKIAAIFLSTLMMALISIISPAKAETSENVITYQVAENVVVFCLEIKNPSFIRIERATVKSISYDSEIISDAHRIYPIRGIIKFKFTRAEIKRIIEKQETLHLVISCSEKFEKAKRISLPLKEIYHACWSTSPLYQYNSSHRHPLRKFKFFATLEKLKLTANK